MVYCGKEEEYIMVHAYQKDPSLPFPKPTTNIKQQQNDYSEL
jgi:hypothetical protein